jgi:UDPglucose--hexose-1-phosphate uridylyltransferase
MSEIRYDPIHDDYTLIAPERLHRPDCLKSHDMPMEIPKTCPFCEGHETMTPPEIFALRQNDPDRPGWKTRVVPNLYKAVQIEGPWRSEEIGMFEKWEGFGAHEVIVDTPRHLLRMDTWSEEEFFNWLLTMRTRLNDLKNDLRLVHFSLFKNHGHYGASTQPHPHTQLVALPVVPRRELQTLRHAHDFYRAHGHSLFESLIAQERKSGERIIVENDTFIALCPYASAFAFEVAIFSKEPRSALSDLDDTRLTELGKVLRNVMEALYDQLDDFDFNITINTPPMQKNSVTEAFFDDIPKMWRFGLRIIPRLFRLGGFELGSGMKINPVAPEEAASLLRGSLQEK